MVALRRSNQSKMLPNLSWLVPSANNRPRKLELCCIPIRKVQGRLAIAKMQRIEPTERIVVADGPKRTHQIIIIKSEALRLII